MAWATTRQAWSGRYGNWRVGLSPSPHRIYLPAGRQVPGHRKCVWDVEGGGKGCGEKQEAGVAAVPGQLYPRRTLCQGPPA